MNFIKTLEKNRGGKPSSNGYLILSNGQVEIRIKTNTHDISQVGIIEGGIGCVLSKRNEPRQTGITNTTRQLNDGDIPENLMSGGYRFRIPAEKLSDTEYVFMFDKAHMLNK